MDFESDGSDYEPMDVEILESDHVLTSCEHGRPLLPIQDVEIPTDYCIDPCTISVAALETVVVRFLRRGIFQKELTQVSTRASTFIFPEFSLPEIQLGKKGHRSQRDRRVIGKTYGTPLHYACRDSNGFRGAQKIRLLLQAAAKAEIPPVDMFTVTEATMKFIRGEWKSDSDCASRHRSMPFFILLDNKRSSIFSIRMLATAWPSIVHLRRVGSDEELRAVASPWGRPLCENDFYRTCAFNTLFHVLVKAYPYESGSTGEDEDRLCSIVATLLEFASMTPKGAEALVSANICEHSTGFGRACNAIRFALAFQQPKLLSLLIKAWPNALKYCGHSCRICLPYPLHSVLGWRSSSQLEERAKMEAIGCMLRDSTIEAVAMALMRMCGQGKHGFQEVMRVLSARSSAKDTQMLDRLKEVFNALLRRKDSRGRTLLHFAIAFECKDLSCCEEQLSLEEKQEFRGRNMAYQMEAIHWILNEKPSQAFAKDNDGLNPFHFALIRGKTWAKGIGDLVKVIPEWGYRATPSGLLPFLLAATVPREPCDELDTIYQLLKYSGPFLFGSTA